MRREDDEPRNPGDGDDNDQGVAVKSRSKTKKPSMYRVLMLNDDYTPMEFVVHVLEHFFNKSHEEATQRKINPDNYHRNSRTTCFLET